MQIPDGLLILLDRAGHEKDARERAETHKEKSFRSREQTDRAFYAQSAAFYAIASGSLDLYDEIMIWSRRYLRDPLSVKTIYGRDAINSPEGIALLSGIPDDLSKYKAHEVRDLIERGNNVVMHIFETAILALPEPSFYHHDWNEAEALFQNVIGARISQSRRLKQSLCLTEDALYDVLWTSSLKMLLKVESIALQPGNERLGFTCAHGPLFPIGSWTGIPAQAAFGPAVYRFIDDLARARDKLWQQHRLTLHPECASLPSCWPRGLPIQALTTDLTNAIDNEAAKIYTPFISSRAQAVIFTEQNSIQHKDALNKEVKAAIGLFVDRYETALQLFVAPQQSDGKHGDRASVALDHALKLYRFGNWKSKEMVRMSEYEALRHCKPLFDRVLPQVKVAAFDKLEELEQRGYPVLPRGPVGLESEERLEWNPMESKSLASNAREVPATFLDCMIATPSIVWFGSLRIPTVEISTVKNAGIWSPEKLAKLRWDSRSVKEGTLAVALLFQESMSEGQRSVFTSPFPSTQDVRYPPLFLDQEFLESNIQLEESVRYDMSALIRNAPTQLMDSMVNNALSALSDRSLDPTKGHVREHFAFRFLKLIAQSDRPVLACDKIIETIVGRPESSSWHRQLLTKTLLRRLSKSQARDFINSFESSIHAKLDEQARLRQGQSQLDPSKPIIKITTLKFLAQFLNDADAVPPEASVQMLCNLLQKSSHIDVRVAVIDSLLSKLSDGEDESTMEEQVFGTFEKLVPVMGSLDERRQMSEEDWQEAERTQTLPEVSDDAPVMNAVYSAFERSQLSEEQSTKILERAILPAVTKSQANNARWVSLFMKKHCKELNDMQPALPAQPTILARLLNSHLSRMPAWVLNLHQEYVLINLQTPHWLKEINDQILDDPDLRTTNAGLHWVDLYDRGPQISHSSGFDPIQFLSSKWEPTHLPPGTGLEIFHLQTCVLDQASALLRLSDPFYIDWTWFIANFSPNLPLYRYNNDMLEAWLAHCKPIFQQVVSTIESIRDSEDWQRDPVTTPYIFLPPTFPLRIQLLEYPQLNLYKDADQQLERFGTQLLAALREVQDQGLASYAMLREVVDAAARGAEGVNEKVRLAAWLGDTKDHFDEDRDAKKGVDQGWKKKRRRDEISLRVEIADGLLAGLEKEVLMDQKKEEMKRLVGGWVGCRIEAVRMTGERLARRMDIVGE